MEKPHLLINIGNSRAKASVRQAGEWLCHTSWTDNDAAHLQPIIEQYHPQVCAYSCVGQPRPQLEALLAKNHIKVLKIGATMASPLSNVNPELGADQFAAIVGAVVQKPGTDLLVIDSGTCLTYDFVSANAEIIGVNISPGLYMRLQAMHDHTALLPLVSPDGEVPAMGYDTDTALRCGSLLGIRYEVEGAVNNALASSPTLHVFLTGGDPFSYQNLHGPRITHEPHLVELGLDALLAYHNLN